MNLLLETTTALKTNGHKLSDIKYCEMDGCHFTLEDFKELADLDYDNASGRSLIARDLRLYGDDFWLERYDFDGTEGWSFEYNHDIPREYKKPERLINI